MEFRLIYGYLHFFLCRNLDGILMCFIMRLLVDILPKETIVWKLELLRIASLFVNSRLHAVKAQTLVLVRYELQVSL
jgi:hypothetical protein